MKVLGTQSYRFGDIELDASQGCIKLDGREQYLRQKAFQLLLYLLEHRDRLVTKEELIANIWEGAAVSDDALVQLIKEVRRSLGDDPRQPQFIRTVPKAGYRFIAPVAELTSRAPGILETREVTTVEVEYEEDSSASNQHIDLSTRALPSSRSTQLMRRSVLIPALAAIAVAALALGIYLRPVKRSLTDIALPQVPGKKAVAVMYFENQSQSRDLDWLREGLEDMLITDLSHSRKLTVLSRQQLHLLLERIGHAQADVIRLDDAVEIGRRSQADAIALGSFARVGEKIRINVNLYDAQTSQSLASESLVADKTDDILNQVDLLSLKLAARLGASSDEQSDITTLARAMTNNLDAYRYYSLALEKAQAYHTTDAIELWKRAIALDPEFAMAYARIGYTYTFIRINEASKARSYLEEALRLSHRLTDKDRLSVSAWYALANGDVERGIQSLREIIARYPWEVDAYLRLGYLCENAGRPQEATAVYKQGLLFDPEATDIRNALGFACSALGRYDEAIEAHRSYVQLAASEPNAHDSLGMTYNEAGHYEEALSEFERALALNPDFHFARLHLGDVYCRLGSYKRAIAEYQRFLEVAPSDWDLAVGYHRMALLYWRKGDLQAAEAAARQESRHKNNLGGALLIALARGDLQTAEKLKESLLSKPPSAGELLSSKNVCYLRGHYALKTGHGAEGIEYFKEALRQPPLVWNVDGIEDCLADAYLELGYPDEAITEYERILSINPNFPLAHYHLAQAYERTGSPDRARAEYARFLQIWRDADPDVPELIIARKSLSASS
jgi:tetratricopeptide (TPR) repeat protein